MQKNIFVRIRINLYVNNDGNPQKMWHLINPTETKTVQQFLVKFLKKNKLNIPVNENTTNETCLTLDEYLVPHHESIDIFRDSDTVTIR